MCLLDEVLEWDAHHIRCRSGTHRDSGNPLRAHGRLGAACGIIFPIGLFLAVGDGKQFAPWRAVVATWAIVLALPFLVYLYSLLRAAEGENGWLSTAALCTSRPEFREGSSA